MLQLSTETVAPGSYIFVEDKEPKDYFYIIRSGDVQCIRRYSKSSRTYEPGNVIGVVPCMTGRSQTESVIAKSQVTLVKVPRSQYEEFIMGNPTVAMKIVQMLSRDLRSFNEAYDKKTGNMGSLKDRTVKLYETARYYEEKEMTDAAAFAYYQYLKEAPEGMYAGECRRAYEKIQPKSHAVYLDPSEEANRSYPKGAMIFAEGQTGSEMFIIGSGSVCISKVSGGEEQAIVYFKKGDLLGEMALLENEFRSANAIAAEDCNLLVLNRKNFDHMVATQPQYILKLTATLANRYWYSYRRYGNVCLSDSRERLVDMLAIQVEMKKGSLVRPVNYETGLSVQDLMVLCNLEASGQEEVAYLLGGTQDVAVSGGKIIVKDVESLLKQAEFYRKKRDKQAL